MKNRVVVTDLAEWTRLKAQVPFKRFDHFVDTAGKSQKLTRSQAQDIVPEGDAGQAILWQGSPNPRSFALHGFHARKIAIYFAGLLAWCAISAVTSDDPMQVRRVEVGFRTVPLTPGAWYLAVYNANPSSAIAYQIVASYVTSGGVTFSTLG